MKAIEVEYISKSYGEVAALRDVSFDVEAGELFGLIVLMAQARRRSFAY